MELEYQCILLRSGLNRCLPSPLIRQRPCIAFLIIYQLKTAITARLMLRIIPRLFPYFVLFRVGVLSKTKDYIDTCAC